MKHRLIVHLKNKLTTHVLLATAVVEVKNKFNQYVPCRVVLDSASQVNFITERCVQRLKLARNQSSTSIQGINNVNTATHHSVSIHLRSRRTDWHTSLTCAVLPNITSSSPATELDTTTWNLPSDILLADEHFDRPSAIDLLIGADLFYEILFSNRRTRKGYPVLQETVLGWIVSGKTPAVNLSHTTMGEVVALNHKTTTGEVVALNHKMTTGEVVALNHKTTAGGVDVLSHTTTFTRIPGN